PNPKAFMRWCLYIPQFYPLE
ncbi:hypothetical protein BVRB_026730, partial [Beta vulgaris subsp. vulgaris]